MRYIAVANSLKILYNVLHRKAIKIPNLDKKGKIQMESFEMLWKTTLPELEKTVSSISMDTFISKLIPVDIVGNKLVLITENTLFSNAAGSMGDKIRDALARVNKEITDFSIVVAKDKEEYLSIVEEENAVKFDDVGSPINPNLTFDSFVVGSSNEFLYAAAKAVVEHPGESYNPLFVYGGTGLGKTHILMAIANYLKKHRPSLNVVYATCEKFTTGLLESLSKGKNGGAEFRRKYRSVDVLLIDDVQFLSKKASTQEEFFHTFNELAEQGKQIVLTSDRPPKEIEVLEERLRTRFEGGLLADVQPPTIETRIAILRRKSEEKKSPVDFKALSYIAEMDDGDIRVSIGKLNKVLFYAKLKEKPVTRDLIEEALKESAGERNEEMRAEDIIAVVCEAFGISKNDILGKRRNKEFVEPRQVCVYLITEMMSGLPLEKVGQIVGGRDHSTIIHSRDKIAELIKTDRAMAVKINDMKKRLLKQ